MSLTEKWKNDPIKMQKVRNRDLHCRFCTFRMNDTVIPGNTSKCEIYPELKPGKVLYGGKCDQFIRE